MVYAPKKFDMNVVDFPAALEPLVELLAKAVHDTWAAERFAAGWVYGPERDDVKKTHPCLVPYEELPESEKEYDRQTARTTIAMLLAQGCRIEMPTRLLKKETTEPVEVLQKVPSDDDVEIAIEWGKLTEKDALTIRDWISAAHRKLVDLEKGDPRCQKIYDIAKRIKTTYVAFFMEAHDLSSEAFKKI